MKNLIPRLIDSQRLDWTMRTAAANTGISVSEAHDRMRGWMVHLGDSISVNLRDGITEGQLRAFEILFAEYAGQAADQYAHLTRDEYMASEETSHLTYIAGLQAVIDLFGAAS